MTCETGTTVAKNGSRDFMGVKSYRSAGNGTPIHPWTDLSRRRASRTTFMADRVRLDPRCSTGLIKTGRTVVWATSLSDRGHASPGCLSARPEGVAFTADGPFYEKLAWMTRSVIGSSRQLLERAPRIFFADQCKVLISRSLKRTSIAGPTCTCSAMIPVGSNLGSTRSITTVPLILITV